MSLPLPFSKASLRSVCKLQNCSMSADIDKLLINQVPNIISLLPKDHVFKRFASEKKVMCNKKWFDLKLGEQNYSRQERENVRQNCQILLTKILLDAGKNTKLNKKKIIQASTVESYLNAYVFHYINNEVEEVEN